jgi:hypothetical protein
MRHTLMRHALGATLVAVVLLTGLAQPVVAQTTPDAATILDDLRGKNYPVAAFIGASSAVTREDDPEQLLGLPREYTSKVTFADTRVAPAGGSIEVFRTSADLVERVVHLQRSPQPLPREHYYAVGSVLMRVSGNLPSDAAAAYGTSLSACLAGSPKN